MTGLRTPQGLKKKNIFFFFFSSHYLQIQAAFPETMDYSSEFGPIASTSKPGSPQDPSHQTHPALAQYHHHRPTAQPWACFSPAPTNLSPHKVMMHYLRWLHPVG